MELLWNDERMGRLETLYREGKSFSLIAAEIGVSRNAAIGKAHRMKLPKRVEILQCKVSDRAKAARPPRRRFRAVAVPVEPEPEIIPNYEFNCAIYELRDCSCRWPLWGANSSHSDRLYCGTPDASVSNGVSYCRRHRLLCRKLNAV